LLKSDTPINKAKVSLKLHELEYKLDVEKKVQEGTKKLAHAYGADPASQTDRRRRHEVSLNLAESNEKIALLKKAVQKYKNLYIGEGDDDDELDTAVTIRGTPGMRRPITGRLQLKIIAARHVAHAPTWTFKAPETLVVVKIDGNVSFKTRPSRSDKWGDDCDTHVDKASEVEISLYDQSGDKSMPIGVLWLKISDIAEGLRRKKLEMDSGAGWVPAEVAAAQAQQSSDQAGYGGSSPQGSLYGQSPQNSQGYYEYPPGPGQLPPPSQSIQFGNNTKPSENAPPPQDGIEAWFDVEPVGQISLKINFIRESQGKRRMDGLGRAVAVRQRKEEVHEMNGHKFVEKRFYQIMRCALCGEFLVNNGYQCEGGLKARDWGAVFIGAMG
ncbi:hypothetical protein BC937DRAFT_86329, partial [Endogone sp. FLAS-F59071]